MRPIRVLVDRLRATFSVRRQTLLGPLVDAYRLRAVVRRITNPRTARVLAPDGFAPYLRELTALSALRQVSVDPGYDHIIIRQDGLGALDRRVIGTLAGPSYVCVYANAAYALFTPRECAGGACADAGALNERLRALLPHSESSRRGLVRRTAGRALLVTTFNRPEALRRSLPQIAALGHDVLVVDDGSGPREAETNRAHAASVDAQYLFLPENRGLAAAINAGMSYLLADSRTRWISYFQDDVDVDPSLMTRLAKVEQAEDRPVLTGYDADEHPAEREDEIAGERVRLKRLSPAVHLHAHVAYWQRVLPIPTQYLGAPKRRWEPSLEDYWIIKDAPDSIWRRGLLIPCLPGLVRTFLWHESDSTWGNPNLAEPPLARRSDAI